MWLGWVPIRSKSQSIDAAAAPGRMNGFALFASNNKCVDCIAGMMVVW